MKQITRDSINALLRGGEFRRGNMIVCSESPNRSAMYLHGNLIAERIGYGPDYSVILRDAGWRTVTTKDRLNGILHALNAPAIYQRDFVWYVDGPDAITKEPRTYEWRGAMVLSVYAGRVESWYLTTRERAGTESFNLRAA